MNLKEKIRKIIPDFLIKLAKKANINFACYKKGGQYKILRNPDFRILKLKYQDTWKNPLIPQRQLKLVKKELPEFYKIAPIKSIINLLHKINTSNKNLLEIGCSTGYYSEVFKRAGFNLIYEGCDFSESFISLAKKQYPEIHFKLAEATNLKNYNDNQFDIVISGCCILHIVDYNLAIAEAARVAKDVVVFHRTPVIHQTETLFLTKTGYGIEMLEIFFNEENLINLFHKNGLHIQHINTHQKFAVKNLNEPVFMKSYLCRKIYAL